MINFSSFRLILTAEKYIPFKEGILIKISFFKVHFVVFCMLIANMHIPLEFYINLTRILFILYQTINHFKIKIKSRFSTSDDTIFFK